MKNYKVEYKLKYAKNPPQIQGVLNSERGKFNVVAVYGGDGSIVSAIKALIESNTKLLILPGGTANTVASDLNLPLQPEECLKMYLEGRFKVHSYDIATANNDPLVLDMHSGWWSEAIKETPTDLKSRFGEIAYGISAIKKLPVAQKQQYKMSMNGKTHRVKSYTVLVANQGFQNFLGIPLFPWKHRSGMVQIATINSLSPWRLVIWLLGKKY